MKLTKLGFAFTEQDMVLLRRLKQVLVKAQGPPVTMVAVVRYAVRKALEEKA